MPNDNQTTWENPIDGTTTSAEMLIDTTRMLAFTYTNYRGETDDRRAYPRSLRFGTSPWHHEPQWLMTAEDVAKGQIREFAMRDMKDVKYADAF